MRWRSRRASRGAVRRAAPPGGERGQSTVEFVALLPILVLAGLVMGQAVVAGYAAWSAAGAARAGARASALGDDPQRAALRDLPGFLGRGSRVDAVAAGKAAAGLVTVRLVIPSIVPGLRFGSTAARAQLPDQTGGS